MNKGFAHYVHWERTVFVTTYNTEVELFFESKYIILLFESDLVL